ncbi:hypothetical protein MP228_005647 [Amoeboaphelidium protococcarum]|nr:hypothetical protein MP228_005647 [Amoeboaphelidium protococcarum]
MEIIKQLLPSSCVPSFENDNNNVNLEHVQNQSNDHPIIINLNFISRRYPDDPRALNKDINEKEMKEALSILNKLQLKPDSAVALIENDKDLAVNDDVVQTAIPKSEDTPGESAKVKNHGGNWILKRIFSNNNNSNQSKKTKQLQQSRDCDAMIPVSPSSSQQEQVHYPSVGGKRVVAYFISWGIYARKYLATDIPADKITHLNYAFAKISQDGQFEVQIGDSWSDIQYMYPGMSWNDPPEVVKGNIGYINGELKLKNPHLKTFISIGGWTWSGNFSTMAASESSRKLFAASCAKFCKTYGFDGIDLDWEYPVEGGLASNAYSPADGVNYTLVMQEIRSSLDQLSKETGKTYYLTIAAPANRNIIRHLEVAKIAQVCDFINIMTYDYRGGWSPFTGHQSPLYPSSDDPYPDLGCTSIAVDTFLNAGCPAEKLNIGAVMYGRGFQGVKNVNNGLYQKYASVPMGTWDQMSGEGATGVFDYKDVVSKQMPKYWDDVVKAPYVYSPDVSDGLMISFDDPQSISAKAQYIKDKNLGGIMFWELSGDIKSDQPGSLIDAAYTALNQQGSSA